MHGASNTARDKGIYLRELNFLRAAGFQFESSYACDMHQR